MSLYGDVCVYMCAENYGHLVKFSRVSNLGVTGGLCYMVWPGKLHIYHCQSLFQINNVWSKKKKK